MTKAGVRGMDAVEAFVAKSEHRDIVGWAVAGASKRGWTTWTVAAVDDRVIAFAPLVLDALNLNANLHHMYQVQLHPCTRPHLPYALTTTSSYFSLRPLSLSSPIHNHSSS